MPALTTRQLHTRTLRVLCTVLDTFDDQMHTALREHIEQAITMHVAGLAQDRQGLDNTTKA